MPITFSRLIRHGTDRLHTALTLPRRCPPHPPGLAIRSLKIWDGGYFRLAQAIQAMERGGFDLMILTEKEIHMDM